MNTAQEAPAVETRARVIHWAFWYDMMIKARSFGRESRFREHFLDIAGVAPGETVLDAGCGTGTMAIAARRRVGDGGAVYGVDAAAEMIARAERKAARAGAAVAFQHALLESLPFPDARFDVVITSFVLHHFPDDLLARCIGEIRRVLKPGGRLVAFDFAAGHGPHRGLFRRHAHPHDTFNLYAITPMLNAAGLVVRERGDAGFAHAVYIKATPGVPADQRELPEGRADAA
jgi:ubiquinone/menaquinone biosynthesis C-methylase UbiE